MNIDKLIRKKREFETENSNVPIASPLSEDNNPRVKKLKKELEKLVIKPTKPKYIKIDFNK